MRSECPHLRARTATFESGRLVADVGYRYRRIFSNDWVTLQSLAQPLNVSEVRIGVGLRF